MVRYSEEEDNKKGIYHAPAWLTPGFTGGAEGDRTPGLMNAIHALSQLSYSPTRDNIFDGKNKNSKILGPMSTIFLTGMLPLNIIFLENSSLYFFLVPCRRGGTGRRAGLKIPCPLGTCRFDSDRRHQFFHGLARSLCYENPVYLTRLC